MATVTVGKGKYKFDLSGQSVTAAGGSWTATKTFSKNTSLEIRKICGGQAVYTYGGNGVGLLEGGTIKLVAGGGAGAGVWRGTCWATGGGGYNGGAFESFNGSWDYAYSWNGALGSSYAKSSTGGGGYASYYGDGLCEGFGGTGYRASDYSATAGTGGSCSITITYCGSSSSSTCP